MRLIDADKIVYSWQIDADGQEHDGVTLQSIISKMPTIEERKKGKWVKVNGYCTPGGDPVWACSECGKGIHVYGIEHGSYGADVSDGQWKACPNCGAKMEG